MGEMRLHPAKLTHEQLLKVLAEICDGFRAHDTLEGSIEFLVSIEEDDRDDEDAPLTWDVTASYRIGNQMGQGGMRMIGEWKAVEPPPAAMQTEAKEESHCTGCGHSKSAHLFQGKPSYCHHGDCECAYMHGPKVK